MDSRGNYFKDKGEALKKKLKNMTAKAEYHKQRGIALSEKETEHMTNIFNKLDESKDLHLTDVQKTLWESQRSNNKGRQNRWDPEWAVQSIMETWVHYLKLALYCEFPIRNRRRRAEDSGVRFWEGFRLPDCSPEDKITSQTSWLATRG